MSVTNEFITVKELSRWIKISCSKIYALVTEKRIPYNKVGGKLLFDKQKILDWIQEQSK